MLAADLTGKINATNGPRAVVPWHGHEASFIRIGLHLAYRAEVIDYAVTYAGVLEAAMCGLQLQLTPTVVCGNASTHHFLSTLSASKPETTSNSSSSMAL